MNANTVSTCQLRQLSIFEAQSFGKPSALQRKLLGKLEILMLHKQWIEIGMEGSDNATRLHVFKGKKTLILSCMHTKWVKPSAKTKNEWICIIYILIHKYMWVDMCVYVCIQTHTHTQTYSFYRWIIKYLCFSKLTRGYFRVAKQKHHLLPLILLLSYSCPSNNHS